MGFKKYDGSTWQSITPKQLKGMPYSGTLPAVLTGTKAGYLHKYKIYGNLSQNGTPTPENPIVPSECGERSENLFSSVWETGGINANTGENVPTTTTIRTKDYIPVTANQIYSFSRSIRGSYIVLRLYDSNKGYISGSTAETTELIEGYTVTQPMGGNTTFCCFKIIDSNVKYLRIVDNTNDLSTRYMMVEGQYTASTIPTYEPYGYKLPLTSGSTPVDIYIGDDTLSDVEYVDSGTGKIYRMVSGVLTPTDPPVPFPQIPTTANSTIISWDGEGLAPSEFDSIQEWVDIPTYKRVNGEWVADN